MVNEKTDIEKLLQQGEAVEFYPQGWSMYPLIIPGRDAVVVEPIRDGYMPVKGDVVLFRSDKLILHRVHHVDETGFYEWGDNSLIVNGAVGYDMIRGRMTAMIRKGRRLSVKNILYKIYVKIWPHIQPVRRLFRKAFKKSQE